ncbi:UDP-N-acetylmuramate dehydrogenase [Selenomonadales bacterium OttesenSCG-928-I06]|nr:UDP-N-acetylmuramate dehydrogenase [Selenomonadales bacterium OttesenSCG-928-I06]
MNSLTSSLEMSNTYYENGARNDFVDELRSITKPGCLLFNEPMSAHTTFKIGGPADYLVMPTSFQEVSNIVGLCRKYKVPVTILGNGSNVLVLDKGVRGVVLKFTDKLAYIKYEDDVLYAGTGAMLKDVSKYSLRESLIGLEFAIGIPGSVGGAVFMNAGAYGGEMSQVVSAVTAITEDNKIKRFTKEELNFGYRHSIFQETFTIILEVEFSLRPGDRNEIMTRMDEYTEKRESRQPVDSASAGSVFKRPEGNYAGTLIENSGLKGVRIGGAEVSLKHAGFIVNAGDATAKDVLDLIEKIRATVYDKFQVELKSEVRVIGEK